MSLWIMIGIILLISVIIIVLPLIRRPLAHSENHNAIVYQDQLAEIESDVERGLLNETEAKSLAAEINKRLGLTKTDQPSSPPKNLRQIKVAVILVLIIPLAALGLYRHLGSPASPDLPYAERTINPPSENADVAKTDMTRLVDALEKRLIENPDKIEGWLLLGTSQMSLERYGGAARAFKRAFQLDSTRSEIATSIAEASFMAAGAKFDADARSYFLLAQSLNPREHKALFYLGLDQARQQKFSQAIQIWTNLMAISPTDAPWTNIVQKRLQKAAKDGDLNLADFMPQLEPVANTAPGPTAADVKAAEEMSPEDRQAFIRSMVERLADRLKEEPNDIAGWRRLARAYKVLGETEKAAAAEAHINSLVKTLKK